MVPPRAMISQNNFSNRCFEECINLKLRIALSCSFNGEISGPFFGNIFFWKLKYSKFQTNWTTFEFFWLLEMCSKFFLLYWYLETALRLSDYRQSNNHLFPWNILFCLLSDWLTFSNFSKTVIQGNGINCCKTC